MTLSENLFQRKDPCTQWTM